MRAFESAHLPSLPGFSPVPGVTMTPLSGEQAMINYIVLEPGAVVPKHSHSNEQLGYVLSGSITMNANGVANVLHAGDAYAMQGGVEHDGTAGADGCIVIDVFAPPRADYAERGAEARRTAG